MDNSNRIRDFLTSRRGRVTPEQVGMPIHGARRVPGLRRNEVAILAGVSVEYYTRLERGNLSGVSEGVLEALATALRLNDLEHAHLFDLARDANSTLTARASRVRRSARRPVVRPGVQRIIDSMVGTPAFVRTSYFDIVAANQLGRALVSVVFDSPLRPVNTARFVFLDPRAAQFYPEWDRTAKECVGALQLAAGKNPYDRKLTDLIGELSTRGDVFRTLWAAQDVFVHRTGTKRMCHPVVGELELSFEAFDLPADEGLSLTTYTAEPGSATAEGLALLASWAATSQSGESVGHRPN